MSPRPLTLAFVNDVYETARVSNKGGFAELCTHVNRLRAERGEENVIFTVNGDFLSASSSANEHKGAHMIHYFEHLKVDAVVAGNHEFDYGNAVLSQRIAESSFPWLGANIRDKETGEIFADMKACTVLERSGLKIGLFGVCTEYTPQLSFPGENVEFTDYLTASRACVATLQERGVDMVVALTHVSIAEDKELATKISGIDVIIGGHDHHSYSEQVGSTLIMKAGHDAHYLGVVELLVKPRQSAGRTLVDLDSWAFQKVKGEADQGMLALVEKYTVVTEESKETLCRLPVPLDSDTRSCRSRETSFPALVADCLRESYGADIGMINGGFIRGDSFYEQNTILTGADIEREVPFPSPTVMIRVTGQQVINWLNETLDRIPMGPTGSFPHTSGLRVHYHDDVDWDEGKDRVVEVRWGPEWGLLDPTRTYTCALTQFMTMGDGIESLKDHEKVPHQNNGKMVRQLLHAYLKGKDELPPPADMGQRLLAV